MAATFTTVEEFQKATTPEAQMKKLVSLRVKAGCIRSKYKTAGAKWVLETEWNVIGSQ